MERWWLAYRENNKQQQQQENLSLVHEDPI
jgi:hypothetical protein